MAPPDVGEIRRMRVGDLEQILAIESASFSAPWSEAAFRFEIEQHPYGLAVVVVGAKGVLAYACCWLITPEIKINNVAVAAEHRRAGLGRSLVDWLLREAAARGMTRAELEVRASNEAARKLYFGLGFVETGRRDGYYSSPAEPAVLMSRELGPSP